MSLWGKYGPPLFKIDYSVKVLLKERFWRKRIWNEEDEGGNYYSNLGM